MSRRQSGSVQQAYVNHKNACCANGQTNLNRDSKLCSHSGHPPLRFGRRGGAACDGPAKRTWTPAWPRWMRMISLQPKIAQMQLRICWQVRCRRRTALNGNGRMTTPQCERRCRPFAANTTNSIKTKEFKEETANMAGRRTACYFFKDQKREGPKQNNE